MARLVFETGKQKEFIDLVLKQLNLKADELGKRINLSARTIRDWRREKFCMADKAAIEMAEISGIAIPQVIEKREDYWSAKKYAQKGAMKRLELYGVTLTRDDRRKGGVNSQLVRRLFPEKYKALGCPIPKDYILPRTKSEELAEFMGIMLGDGGITPDQFSITLNSIADAEYILYVRDLLKTLFEVDAYMRKRKEANAMVFILSGVKLIAFLKKCGLRVGNKVRNQVDVPIWVKNSACFDRFCLRGLMDTDGGIHKHTYIVNGKKYSYLKTCFTNKSQPLRRFVYQTLIKYGFHPKYRSDNKVWLYAESETERYLDVIGSSNERLRGKLML